MARYGILLTLALGAWLAAACSSSTLPGPGEACAAGDRCAAGASCVEGVCRAVDADTATSDVTGGADTAAPEDATGSDLPFVPDGCEADCGDRVCGSDGCGGLCGTCESGFACGADGQCHETSCTPQCDETDCGPDRCGGLCGTCGAGTTCSDGACIPGACGEGQPVIEGEFRADVANVAFDSVVVALTHKRDVDPWEDGCLSSIQLDFAHGAGCALHVEAGGAVGAGGAFRLTEFSFVADSQCPGFSDDREGAFEGLAGLTLGDVAPLVLVVPDANAAESCFATSITLRLAGTLPERDGGASLEVQPSALRVTGEFRSTGDTQARCPCRAECDGKECGDDGCGGVCGNCPAGHTCSATGQCECTPDCGDRVCGDNGCGGSCGDCDAGEVCGDAGTCVCDPQCGDRQCGPDACDGRCGICPLGYECTGDGYCECAPDCVGKNCGNDGCGGSCGTCDVGVPCSANGICGCATDCTGRQCGDDGCGGSCGDCGYGETCEADGTCGCGDLSYQGCCDGTLAVWCDTYGVVQSTDCVFQGCGWKDAQTGYTCGYAGEDPTGGYPIACPFGICESDCAGRECGDDGCGGSCGGCPSGETCLDGSCEPCATACDGRECGDDGCGGSCGSCGAGESCYQGQCTTEAPLEEYGKACTTDADCHPSLVCRSFLLPGMGTCTRLCDPAANDCPEGFTCIPDLSGGAESFCMNFPFPQ